MVKHFLLLTVVALSGSAYAVKTTTTQIATPTSRESTVMGQVQSAETRITEQQRIKQLATSQNMTTEEWTRYESIMQGEGKYHWSDADPVLVLGMYSKDSSERRRYAEMMARKEHAMQEKFIAFNREYMAAFDRLYGNEKILDLDVMMAMYDQQQTDQATNGQSNILTGLGVDTSKASNPIETIGDRIILFVNTSSCTTCDDYYRNVRSIQSFSSMDIYFVGDKRDDISAWAKRMRITPDEVKSGVITLNPDKNTYARYGSPSLPSSFYYSKKDGSVSAFVPE